VLADGCICYLSGLLLRWCLPRTWMTWARSGVQGCGLASHSTHSLFICCMCSMYMHDATLDSCDELPGHMASSLCIDDCFIISTHLLVFTATCVLTSMHWMVTYISNHG